MTACGFQLSSFHLLLLANGLSVIVLIVCYSHDAASIELTVVFSAYQNSDYSWERRQRLVVWPCLTTLLFACSCRLTVLHYVSKNAPTMASCTSDKRGLILIILDRQHQHKLQNDMRIQLSLFLHIYLLYLLLNSCGGHDANHNVLSSDLGRLFVALKRSGFILVDVQSDVLSPSGMHATASSIDQQLRRCLDDVL